MKKTSLYILIMIGLSYSCLDKDNIYDNSDLEVISCSSKAIKEIASSKITDSIKYIQLETDDDCLIANIEQIKVDEDFLVIKDMNNLYVFNNSGKFISKIGKKGHAPDEYINILNFYINRNDKSVVIIDNMRKKALKYSYTGEFIDDTDIDDSLIDLNFCEMNDNNILLTNNLLLSSYTINPYEYQLFKPDSDEYILKESFFPFVIEGGDLATQFSHRPISYHKGHLLFMSSLSNILYEYTDKVKPKYRVKSIKDFPNDEYLVENKDVPIMEVKKRLAEKGLSSGIRAIRELPQYILLCVDGGSLIWDKKNKKGIFNNFFEFDEIELICNLMGGATVESNLGGLINVIESDVILDQQDVIENGANDELKQILSKMKMGDNPILSISYFNDHFVVDLADY